MRKIEKNQASQSKTKHFSNLSKYWIMNGLVSGYGSDSDDEEVKDEVKPPENKYFPTNGKPLFW